MSTLPKRLTSTVLLVAALGIGCERRPESTADTKSAGNRIGHLKGYAFATTWLQARFPTATGQQPLELGWFLDGSSPETLLGGFRALLGGFSGTAAHAEFQNGAPNAVNMLLWDLLAGAVADAFAGVCAPLPVTAGENAVWITALNGEKRIVALKPSLHAKLKASCVLPSDAAERRTVLQALWTAMAGYEMPPAEFEAWLAYFTDPASPVAGAAADLRLRAMLKGLLLNPHFLLET